MRNQDRGRLAELTWGLTTRRWWCLAGEGMQLFCKEANYV
jgi:hypothetical protein